MAGYRLGLPRGRMIRTARGTLICASLAALLVTLLAFYKVEVPTKFLSEDAGKSAQRALQQLDSVCSGVNCSNGDKLAVLEASDVRPIMVVSTKAAPDLEESDAGQDKAVQRNTEIPAEEAIPEELVPDQESPALLVQPKLTTAKLTQQPTTIPAKTRQQEPEQPDIPTELEQEHEQQQQQQAVAVTSPTSTKPPLQQQTKASSKQDKIKVHIKTITSVSRNQVQAISSKSSQIKAEQLPENPPILTKLLYESGHSIKAQDRCPNQGSDLKLMILITTATGHVKEREAVRETWGHVALRKDIGFAFFVGKSKNMNDNL